MPENEKQVAYDIKTGKYSYTDVVNLINPILLECKSLLDTSKLQDKLNYNSIRKIYKQLLVKYDYSITWKNNKYIS